jgi:hypothetical protein
VKIKIDYDSGEAAIEFDKRFLNEDALFRIDVIKDLVYQLDCEYQKAHKEFYSDYDAATPNYDIEETP